MSAASGASDADYLVHNGANLNLGANNIEVAVDYTNANFGLGNSFNPRANVAGTGQINPMPILMRNIRVQGIFVGSREMFEAMNRAITLAKLKPVVDKVFDFKDAVAAYQYMETGRHFGKVVIKA